MIMKRFLTGLLYENGTPSRTGLAGLVLLFVPIGVWAVVTLYLAYTGKAFAYYDTLSMLTFGAGGTGGLTVVGNKIINATLSSTKGEVFDKITPVKNMDGGNQ